MTKKILSLIVINTFIGLLFTCLLVCCNNYDALSFFMGILAASLMMVIGNEIL